MTSREMKQHMRYFDGEKGKAIYVDPHTGDTWGKGEK